MKAHAVGAENGGAFGGTNVSNPGLRQEQKVSKIKDLVENGKITPSVWAQG